MSKAFAGTLAIAAVILLAACQTEGSPPTFEPLPTPTTPPDFVTFSDESNLFSIEYPPEWELALSMMSEMEDTVKELIRSQESDAPVGNTGLLFFAGLPVEDGFLPNVNIAVESLPSEMTTQQYFETGEKLAKQFFTGYKVRQQARLLVGDMESIMIDSEYDLSSVVAGASGKLRVIQLVMVAGKVGWTVSCTIEQQAPTEDLETCDGVVRTFRILQ